MLKSMRKSQNRYFYHIFVSPGDAPAIITQYVAWMERQFSARQTPRSMYTPICNSFPVIRTANAKTISIFTYRSPHFCFPWRRPCDYHAMLHGWKNNSMLVKPLASCTYLSSIVSELYDVKSMRKSKNRYFYHILVSLGTPLGQSR